MSLTTALQLRTPLVWVVSEEPGRVLDFVLATERAGDKRTVYRLDAVDGLMSYHHERGWLQVLDDDPRSPTGIGPVEGMPAALPYVFTNGGVFLVEHAHTIVEMLFGFFTSVMHRYRDAFLSNDAAKLPAQFLLISHKPEIPHELARFVSKITTELPDEQELSALTKLLFRERELPDSQTITSIVRAAKGMSEHEFVSAGLSSLRDDAGIDPVQINRAKLAMLKDSGILEVSTPTAELNQLGGLDNLKELIDMIQWAWNNSEDAAEFGVKPKRRLLLVGVPGTGKSLAAKVIAATLGLDLAKGGVSNALSKWVGESEANMRRMFQLLKAMKPITFWMDEFGRDMSGSGTANDSGTTDRVHGEFLTGMQELDNEIFLVGAANNISGLPPEMLRSGRFDSIMFVGFPTQGEREEIFRIHLGKRAELHDVTALAEATPYFTGAEIEALLDSVRFKIGAGKRRHFTSDDVLADVPNVRGRVWINRRSDVIAMYERAMVEWEWASSTQQAEADKVLSVSRGGAQKSPATAGGLKLSKW